MLDVLSAILPQLRQSPRHGDFWENVWQPPVCNDSCQGHSPLDGQNIYVAASPRINSIHLLIKAWNYVLKFILGQCVEKPRGYHGEWSPLGSPKAENPRGHRPRGFWPRDFPRDSVHHDKPKAFPHIFILLSFWTSKEGFLALPPNPTFP